MPLFPKPEVRSSRLNAVPVAIMAIGWSLILLALPRFAYSDAAGQGKPAPAPAVSTNDPQKLREQVDELSRQVSDLAQKREALKDRLDAISQQASQNQWLLTIVLAVAGLLTLAQGVFAFFSAQNYVKQADDAVKKIETLAEEVRSRYPLFSQMEDARETAFRRLADLSRRLDLDQNLYSESDPMTRQEILSLESFAAIQFVASSARAPHIVDNLRLLGKFYADKYVSGGRTSEADFERASYYCELAVSKSGRDFCALNDLAWLHSNHQSQGEAEKLFEESLGQHPDQQRANYNLGTMSFEAKDRAKLGRARRYLEKAAGLKNWERTPNEEFSCHVHYNLACAYSRLSEYEEDVNQKQELLNLAIAYLDKAAEKGGTTRDTLEGDLANNDLAALAQSAEHARQLLSIKGKFERAWTARGRV